MEKLLDVKNHPILIHCNKGKVSFPISNNICLTILTKYPNSIELAVSLAAFADSRDGTLWISSRNTDFMPVTKPDPWMRSSSKTTSPERWNKLLSMSTLLLGGVRRLQSPHSRVHLGTDTQFWENFGLRRSWWIWWIWRFLLSFGFWTWWLVAFGFWGLAFCFQRFVYNNAPACD